jgi:hypothetical protein
MGDQLTVRLPPDLSKALRTASRRMKTKNSEIVRRALREFLGTQVAQDIRPADRVRSLIGSLQSGIPDLGEKHRECVIESLRRGR